MAHSSGGTELEPKPPVWALLSPHIPSPCFGQRTSLQGPIWPRADYREVGANYERACSQDSFKKGTFVLCAETVLATHEEAERTGAADSGGAVKENRAFHILSCRFLVRQV